MSVWVSASLLVNEMEAALAELLEGTAASSLSAVQLHVLGALYENDHQRPSDLASACGRAPASFTAVLDSLEALNLLKRSPDKNDRRAVSISLTVKANALRKVIENALVMLDDIYHAAEWPVLVERTAKPVAV